VTLDFTKLGTSFTFKFARAFNPAISFASKSRSCSSDLQRQKHAQSARQNKTRLKPNQKKKFRKKISFSQLRSSATNTRNPALAGYWMNIQNRAGFDPGPLKNQRVSTRMIPEMTPANRVRLLREPDSLEISSNPEPWVGYNTTPKSGSYLVNRLVSAFDFHLHLHIFINIFFLHYASSWKKRVTNL
jgi:hypothetical protein